MSELEEVKIKLEMACSGLNKTRNTAEELNIPDEGVNEIKDAQEAASRALKLLDDD